MNRKKMHSREQEVLKQMKEMALPGSMEYMAKIPRAANYIINAQFAYRKDRQLENVMSFDQNLDRYFNAWKKIWRKMALEQYNPEDVTYVDMQVYRHLPDGYSFKVYSHVLDETFTVYPREPKKKPKGFWITAAEVIDILDNPGILEVMKAFPGSWIDREARPWRVSKEVLEERKKVVAKLKFKHTKKGWDYYEEESSNEREPVRGGPKKISKKDKSSGVYPQNKRLFHSRNA